MFDMNSLKAKTQKLNSEGGIPFMDGRTHGGELPNKAPATLDGFGFITGENGEYAVISMMEYPDFFFFGGSVITQKLKELEVILLDAGVNLADQTDGIPIMFERKTNKTGKKEYTTCTFYPEV